MAGKPKTLAKLVEFGYPIEMMGNKATVSNRKGEIQVFDWGVKITSNTSRKSYRVYASNIKAVEVIPALVNEEE